MSGMSVPDCFVCRKHRGEINLPGGVIYEDSIIFITHATLWGKEKEHYLGHVFIEVKRHVAEIAHLTEKEAQAIGLFTTRVARALLQTLSMEHIYSFFVGDGAPHVHIHVIGRYPGAPREYWGIKVDEWPDAPKGGMKEMGQVARKVREFLIENFNVNE